jgi:endonuclease-3
MRRRLTKAQAEALFERLAALHPQPRTELVFTNPYTLLVAVVLSAQATDRSVNKATADLFPMADSPARMVDLGEEELVRHIKTIGLWRTKAKNVIALSQALIREHGGAVPQNRAALEQLPGVGRKTANVVLLEAFGVETIAVDTHVFRVANRTGLAQGRTPQEVESQLMRVTPARFLKGAHHWLILHGRYICVARKPQCPRCPIADLCRYDAKTAAIAPTKLSAPSGAKARKR